MSVRFAPRRWGTSPNARSPRGARSAVLHQPEVAAGLVDQDEAASLDPLGLLVQGARLRLVAPTGAPRLSFRVPPHPRAIARLIVA